MCSSWVSELFAYQHQRPSASPHHRGYAAEIRGSKDSLSPTADTIETKAEAQEDEEVKKEALTVTGMRPVLVVVPTVVVSGPSHVCRALRGGGEERRGQEKEDGTLWYAFKGKVTH